MNLKTKKTLDSILSEWQQIPCKNQFIIKNKISKEQFSLFSFKISEQSKNLIQWRARSLYNLPKTPKISIVKEDQDEMLLMVQKSHSTFNHMFGKFLLYYELLNIVKDVCLLAENLMRKYGCFKINEKMLGINKYSEITLWINEYPIKNFPSFPLKSHGQNVMIDQIIEIVSTNSSFNFNLALFRGNNKKFISFISAISELIQHQKYQLFKSFQQKNINHNRKQKDIFNHKNQSFYSYAQMTFSKTQKGPKIMHGKNHKTNITQNNVPKFLQKNREQKATLLESVNHRRTATILEQDSQLVGRAKSNEQKINVLSPSKNFLKRPKIHTPQKSVKLNFIKTKSNEKKIQQLFKNQSSSSNYQNDSYPSSPSIFLEPQTPQDNLYYSFKQKEKQLTNNFPFSSQKIFTPQQKINLQIPSPQETNIKPNSIEQEFQKMFPKSPRITLNSNDEQELRQQFTRLISF